MAVPLTVNKLMREKEIVLEEKLEPVLNIWSVSCYDDNRVKLSKW